MKESSKSRSKTGFSNWVKLLLMGCLVVGVAAIGWILYLGSKGPSLIPTEIKDRVSHVIYYPSPGSGVIVDSESFKYDETNKLVSFTARHGSNEMTIAEQPTPENFVDIPQAFDKLIETLNAYASFDSFYGTVHLTKPKEFNGQQSAVMNSKGTMMFAKVTEGSLTDDQWKKIFNNLEVIR